MRTVLRALRPSLDTRSRSFVSNSSTANRTYRLFSVGSLGVALVTKDMAWSDDPASEGVGSKYIDIDLEKTKSDLRGLSEMYSSTGISLEQNAAAPSGVLRTVGACTSNKSSLDAGGRIPNSLRRETLFADQFSQSSSSS